MIIKNVKFAYAEDFYGVFKMNPENTPQTLRDHVATLPKEFVELAYPDGIESFLQTWDNYKAYTIPTAIRKLKGRVLSTVDSSIQVELMVAMSLMDARGLLKYFNGSVFKEEILKCTVSKKRAFNPNMIDLLHDNSDFELHDVIYEDTYRLYKLTAKEFARKGVMISGDLLILEAEVFSLGKYYVKHVDANQEQCQTPIGAAAWLMEKEDGSVMTREEFIQMNNQQ